MQFPLTIGEQTTLKDPETGEPVTVRVTAGKDGKVTVIVEAVPGSPVKVSAPPKCGCGVSVQDTGLPRHPLSSTERDA